jgi:hypothetical protein
MEIQRLVEELMGFNVDPTPRIVQKLKNDLKNKITQILNNSQKLAKSLTKSLEIEKIN